MRRWWLGPDPLAVVAIVAAGSWGAAAVVDGRSVLHLAPVAVTVVLVGVAVAVRTRSGPAPEVAMPPRWFVPAVVLVAVVGAVFSVDAGVSALVMSTPAATMLAVPLALATGDSRGRAAGVQLGPWPLVECTGRVDTLVLGKDGTLTTGDLTVVSVDPVEPDHDRNLRWFAGALEKASDHPVGRAVATLAPHGRPSDVETVAGAGIRGSVDRHPVRVGTPEWIGVDVPDTIWTTVGVEVDGRLLGTVTVADDVRPDLQRDVGRLTDLGLHLVVVSGDTHERTRHVAGLAGIRTFHALAGTHTTLEVVRALAREGRVVATVGVTGVTGAALSVAMPGQADDEVATIVGDDLAPARLARALEAARATVRRVGRTRSTTVGLGIVGALAGASGLVPAVAVAATALVLTAITAVVATNA